MPPNAPLESDTCPTLLEELYPQIWLGSWLERVEAREVIFNSEAADACMTTLRNASCGEELRAALFDPTCFSNIPPSGGEEQRNLFSRLPRFDEACAPIRDGFGGLYFGSCDPNRSFCCVASDELDGGCTPFPVPGKPAPANQPHHSENPATTCRWHFARLVSFATTTLTLARSIAMSL